MYGWSKVQYQGKYYFVTNSVLNRSSLSTFPKEVLKKDTKVYVIKNNKIKKSKVLRKGKKVTLVCTFENGKFKGYDYLSSGINRYLRK